MAVKSLPLLWLSGVFHRRVGIDWPGSGDFAGGRGNGSGRVPAYWIQDFLVCTGKLEDIGRIVCTPAAGSQRVIQRGTSL